MVCVGGKIYCIVMSLLRLQKKTIGLIFHAYYSRVKLQDVLSYEHTGYVLNAFSEIKPNAKQDIVYLCGNPNMVDEVFTLLVKTYAFPTEIIRREKYISSN